MFDRANRCFFVWRCATLLQAPAAVGDKRGREDSDDDEVSPEWEKENAVRSSCLVISLAILAGALTLVSRSLTVLRSCLMPHIALLAGHVQV